MRLLALPDLPCAHMPRAAPDANGVPSSTVLCRTVLWLTVLQVVLRGQRQRRVPVGHAQAQLKPWGA